MLLLEDGQQVDGSSAEALALILCHASIQTSNDAFLNAGRLVDAAPGSPCLWVFQGEKASLSYDAAQQLIVGTEDATTCVILGLACPATRRVALAHLDDATCNSACVLPLLHGMRGPVRAFLTGGYTDAHGEGQRVCVAVLAALHSAPQRVCLQLACIGAANTDASGAPRCRELALALPAGEPFPGVHLCVCVILVCERLEKQTSAVAKGWEARGSCVVLCCHVPLPPLIAVRALSTAACRAERRVPTAAARPVPRAPRAAAVHAVAGAHRPEAAAGAVLWAWRHAAAAISVARSAAPLAAHAERAVQPARRGAAATRVDLARA